MRRALFVLMVVSMVGLTSAVASSFSANVEDVESFTTAVSLTTPADPPTPFPPDLWVRGPDGAGTLDLAAPPVFDTPLSKRLNINGEEVRFLADPNQFLMWRSPVAPVGGYLLSGNVTLFIDQDGLDTNRMSASLFACPPTTPSNSIGCSELANTVGTVGTDEGDDEQPNDFEERSVPFGNIYALVPAGMELRLKVMNRLIRLQEVLSTSSWHLQWGYRTDRQSRLETSP